MHSQMESRVVPLDSIKQFSYFDLRFKVSIEGAMPLSVIKATEIKSFFAPFKFVVN